MPIVEEWVYSSQGESLDNNFYTATWEINRPPSPTLVKVFINSFMGVNGPPIALVYITSYRRRLPSGADEKIDIPTDQLKSGLFEPSLTSVTFGLTVRFAVAYWTGVLEIWG